MKRKPGWGFFGFWVAVYTAMDLVVSYLMEGHFAWAQLNVAVEGALLAATMTWLFALWKWYKSEGF